MREMTFHTLLSITICVVSMSVAQTSYGQTSTPSEEPLQYTRDIRPILAEYCFACHGQDSASREADLRLDIRDEALDFGAIEPNDPDSSELIRRIYSDDEDFIMPPQHMKKPMKDEERERLKRWIQEGAKYEEHWALTNPQKPELPTVTDASWPRNAIDHFVLNRLESEGLKPAKALEPRAIFRRLHLDITGLPPQPADIESFEAEFNKNSEEAMSTWIDRLMATPAWGEHRGRYWLDAARYADTHGMHYDNYREMWPYRDWVIRSFNSNQPFDQFTIEQLAGDLLENPTTEQLIATGFQRCNMTTNEGGTIEDENLAIYAADRVQTFGWVYLGLTTNCCQCHDHKFDPLTMKDYYSLAAFFRNTTQKGLDGNSKDGRGPVIRVPSEEDKKRWDVIDSEIAAAVKARKQRRAAANDPFLAWLKTIQPVDFRGKQPQKNLLVSLPLNEGSGNEIAAVVAGNDFVPTATGDLDWSVEGKFGSAVLFKPGHTIEVGSAGDFARDQPFSHSEWIRTPQVNQNSSPVARMDEQNAHRGWDLFFANGHLAVHLIQSWPGNAIKVTTKAKLIKPNTWHHVCVTWNGSGKPEGISIYVDGIKRPTNINTNNLKPDADIRTTTPMRIGQRSQSAVFNGSVQDFQLFDRLLTQDEIVALRNSELMALALETPAEQRTESQKSDLFEHYLNEHDSEFTQLAAAVESLQQEKADIESRSPITHVQVERKDQPPMANILMRGQYDKVGAKVTATTPEALHSFPNDAPANRLGLAQWVVDPANPLTARVTVNRFWQEVFGQGIVVTTEDFGVMGSLPSHPDLLDWLATDFVENGWDVKRFYKQIFMSATYRQASVTTPEKLLKDRDNLLLSRGPRFRMDAEMVRDYALTVSGLRSDVKFGPGVRPYQPSNIWDVVGLPGGNTRNYRQDEGEKLYRRSVYMFWKRMAPPPSLEAFNAPNREVCTVRRERTNTPLQALVTLNDPQYVEAARNLAENVIPLKEDPNSIANEIALRVLGRKFSETELAIVLQSHRDFAAHYESHPEDAEELLKIGNSPTNESLNPPTVAAWTMTCNQIMNLDEALNK